VKVKWKNRSFFDHSFVKREPLAFHWKTIQKECLVAFSLYPNSVNPEITQPFAFDAICQKICEISVLTCRPVTITDLTCEVVRTKRMGMLCQLGNYGSKSLTRRETATQ
jgi:hypothetical protein